MKKRLLTFVPVLLVVFFCSFNVFANDSIYGYQLRTYNTLSSDGNVRMQAYASVLHDQRETAMYTNSGTYISYETEVLMTFILSNQNSDYDVYCDSAYSFNLHVDGKANLGTQGGETYYTPYKITSVTPLSDDNCFLVNFVNVDSGTYTFNLFPNPQYTSPDSGSRLVVPANSSIVCQFKFTVYGFSATGVTAGDTAQFTIPTIISITNFPSSTWTKGSFPLYAPYYNLTEINAKIDEILEAYHNNATQQYSSDLHNDSDDLETRLDNIHAQEQQWYSDNETAIQATGLSNYQFNPSQISGLTAIRSQFSDIWDSLGDWNLVYIFTLLLSFATFILRHRPTTKAQQRMKLNDQNRVLQRKYYLDRTNQNQGTGDLMQMALRKYAK